MKLYKPKQHKPATGIGYEGAAPWESTPYNAPYEPSFITLDVFPGKRFWTFGMFALLSGAGKEILQELRADGWEPKRTNTQDAFFLLENQFAQTLIVIEQNSTTNYWARTEDIRHAQKYPVFLTYQTNEENSTLALPTGMVMGTHAITMSGSSWHLYSIEQLPEPALSLLARIGDGMKLYTTEDDPTAQERRLREQQRIAAWEQTHEAAQQLATLYWKLHQELMAKSLTRPQGLPALTSARRTRVPSNTSFHALTQSFGPAIQHSLWNQGQTGILELMTPNGSFLQVRGTNAWENVALHRYVTSMLGPEGLKHLLILLDAYYFQTNGEDRKADARVSLRQLLIRLGKGNKADERDEQGKLMHTILYLSSTYITTEEPPETQEHDEKETEKPRPLARQRKSRKPAQKDYSPLLVIERLKPGLDGNITIPDEVEYHLGQEFYDALFGTQQQFFTVPTAQLLRYHAVRQQQELLLAFYLSNAIIASAGSFSVHFPELLEQSALQTQENMNQSHDRLRDAQRALLAIEQLERDELILRSPHTKIDTALAATLALGEQRRSRKQEGTQDSIAESDLAPASYKRIRNNATYLQQLSETEIRKTRREALQQLLDERLHSSIEFSPGPFLKEQIQQRTVKQLEAQTGDQSSSRGRKKKNPVIIDAHPTQKEETPTKPKTTRRKKGEDSNA